jgi:predicted neutral ceramidase superfamily lipid hydrolase
MRNAATPVTLIIVGLLGLVWYFGWLPDVDSITAIALIVAGIAILLMDGVTKHSIVLGPSLIAGGIAWWVHDRYRFRWTLLVSVLLIVIGILMLVARSPKIPEKRTKSGAE